LDLSSAIGVIQGFHAVIGGLARQPHWFLNDQDARRYGQAMANAARHFPLHTTQKALDVTMLIVTAFSIDAPRIAMSVQLAKQPQRQPQRGPAQVFQFHPSPAPAPSAAPPPSASADAAGAAPLAPMPDAPPDPSSDAGAIGGEPAA
jgi:hypothetical protein